MIRRNRPDDAKFNRKLDLPFQLRVDDFRSALQDVYDFFSDVSNGLIIKGLDRLDDMLRPAIMSMSGVISDMLTASLAKHSRSLVVNGYFNGHPDLVGNGEYPGNAVKSVDDFRRNARGDLGTRTATLHARGIAALRQGWLYRV